MYKLSEMFGQRGGWDAFFGRRAVKKNIGIRTDIGQTFAENGTASLDSLLVTFDTISDVMHGRFCTEKLNVANEPRMP